MSAVSKFIQFQEVGGPEVLEVAEREVGQPSAEEVLVRHEAIGLNFIDTYHRTGLYPLPLPASPGLEAAGVIEEVGTAVDGWAVGDRVAYATGPIGAYCQRRLLGTASLIRIPDELDCDLAAALFFKGMTAEYLLHRTFNVQAGQTVLFYGIADGIGLIACQWLKNLGATVIGTVGSSEKAELARQFGCDHVLQHGRDDIAGKVREITDGRGVPVAYDGRAGMAATFETTRSLSPRGCFVSFDNDSGPVIFSLPVTPPEKGLPVNSYYHLPLLNHNVIGPEGRSMWRSQGDFLYHTQTRAEVEASSAAVLDQWKQGLKVRISRTFPLTEAEAAHRALENRETTGSTLLKP